MNVYIYNLMKTCIYVKDIFNRIELKNIDIFLNEILYICIAFKFNYFLIYFIDDF